MSNKKHHNFHLKSDVDFPFMSLFLTFDGVSYDPLGEVSDRTPGVSVVSAGDIAQAGYILPCHQLIGLWRVAQNSDEEQEERACELIVHRAWVHGAVARQESSTQNTHVLPLEQQEEDREEIKNKVEQDKDKPVSKRKKGQFNQITKLIFALVVSMQIILVLTK